MTLSQKKQTAESAKKTLESSEKLVSDEIIKRVAATKLPMLDAAWKGLQFLQKLTGLMRKSDEIKKTAESSPGFADYLHS